MLDLAYDNLPHVLCALLFVARVGDVLTTYLITPNLELEANPVARKLGWRFGLVSIALCLLPYLDIAVAVIALMGSLFVAASNAGKIWLVRTVGERAYAAFLIEVARKGQLSHALLGIAASSFFIALAGGTVLLFYPSVRDWGFYIAMGILLYGAAMWLYGSLFAVRLFRQARQ